LTEPKDASAPSTEDPAKKIVTAEEFITVWPLYTVAKVDGFDPPSTISFACPGTCAKETTWIRSYEPEMLAEKPVDWELASVGYTCMLCKKTDITVIYRKMESEKRPLRQRASTGMPGPFPTPPSMTEVVIGVLKVGQYPAPSVALPKGLEKNLQPEASWLYRKALICKNNGFGLAAASYIRRVVEDKTNELIEVAAQLAESHAIDASVVAKMRIIGNSTDYTPYEEKLKIAATVFPDSLKVGSINPLKTLYNLVSKGIHGLSEAECITIASETADIFEFVFTNLKSQVADQTAFIAKVKKLS
jgi:hypothetical protein